MSDKTVRRRIELAKKKREWWRYYIVPDGRKIYVSCGILSFNKKNLKEINNNEYSDFLRVYDWLAIGTVRPEYCPTPNAAQSNMEQFYKALRKKYPNNHILFCYTTEINPDRSGYHSHFVLDVSDVTYRDVRSWFNRYYRVHDRNRREQEKKHSTHFDEYDNDRKWLEYFTKEMHLYPDHYNLCSTRI